MPRTALDGSVTRATWDVEAVASMVLTMQKAMQTQGMRRHIQVNTIKARAIKDQGRRTGTLWRMQADGGAPGVANAEKEIFGFGFGKSLLPWQIQPGDKMSCRP